MPCAEYIRASCMPFAELRTNTRSKELPLLLLLSSPTLKKTETDGRGDKVSPSRVKCVSVCVRVPSV